MSCKRPHWSSKKLDLKEEYKRSLNWEYAEISLVIPTFGVYVWIYEEGKLKRLKGIEGQNKVMVALAVCRRGNSGGLLPTILHKTCQ